MKLHSKFVWERFVTAIKIDIIPLFDVRCSSVSFSIRLAVFSGQRPRLYETSTKYLAEPAEHTELFDFSLRTL